MLSTQGKIYSDKEGKRQRHTQALSYFHSILYFSKIYLLKAGLLISSFVNIGIREEPWNDKCCSNGFCPNSFSTPPSPPALKQPDPLGLLFSPKISQFFKTAVLTMGMDIFTMTMVKHYSLKAL